MRERSSHATRVPPRSPADRVRRRRAPGPGPITSASTTACEIGLSTRMRSPIAPASSAWPCARQRDARDCRASSARWRPSAPSTGRIKSAEPQRLAGGDRRASAACRPPRRRRCATSPRTSDGAHARHVHILGAQHAAGRQPRGGDRQFHRVVRPGRPMRMLIGSIASPVTDSTALKRPACWRRSPARTPPAAASASNGTSGGVKPGSSMSQSADAPAAISAARTASSASSRAQRPARPVQHRAVRRRGRPPVHAELPGDGAELRRLHHDAAARRRGPGPARGRRSAPASSNRSDSRTTGACSVVIVRSVAASAAQRRGSSASAGQGNRGRIGITAGWSAWTASRRWR